MTYKKILFLTGLLTVLYQIAHADQQGSSNTSLQKKVTLPIVNATNIELQQPKLRPDDSVLEENGYHYLYKGNPVSLLRIKNRFTISYKENSTKKVPRFKNKPFFKNAGFRRLRIAKQQPLEIMSISKTAITGKSSREILNNVITELQNDSSIQYTAPVYYEPKTGEDIIFTDNIIIRVQDENDLTLRETIASITDAEFTKILMPKVLVFKCKNIGSFDVLQRCMAIEHTPGVIWAQPDIVTHFEKCYVPNDPLYTKQWHLQNNKIYGGVAGADMKVSSAWDIQQMADTNITIAVLDQGIDPTHPDLSIKSGGWDYCFNDNDPSPSNFQDNHGTAVAGVAAAIGNNGIGVAGIAAGAKILPFKMLDDSVNLSSSLVANAITQAYTSGADIINNSWGQKSEIPDNILQTAIIEASTQGRNGKGCLVFCASGNDATEFKAISLPFPDTSYCYIALVYKKDSSGSAGDDNIIVDNVILYGSNDSILFHESFEGTSLPVNWATSGGNNESTDPVASIPGWHQTTASYQQGFGDESAFCSGTISNNQWTELRLPYRVYHSGERLIFNVHISTEDHDSLVLRYYDYNGDFFAESGLLSGLSAAPDSNISQPASLDSAIAVGASTDLDFRCDYSQYNLSRIGKTVDFVAPSGGGYHRITTTDRTDTNGYDSTDYCQSFSGTSSATPAASGLAALILSKNPHLSRNKVLEVMRSTCDKIGNVTYTNGINNEYGYGRLNALRALQNLPPVIIGQQPLSIPLQGSVTITTQDLVIVDKETPDGPFTITIAAGSNYSVKGTTITANPGITDTLSIPVTIGDGTYTSDVFVLSVAIRSTNSAPVISGQNPLTMLEDDRLRLSINDLNITDSDDPTGPFHMTIGAGTNYTISADTIIPSPDYNGSLSIPVRVSDWADTSTVFTVTVTVTPVNDAPSFIAGPNVTVNEDCGAYTVSNWATSIRTGPSNESGQNVSFGLSLTDSSLFFVFPSVNPNGTLSFTPASNANGTSTVRIFLLDNGGTDNGGINSSDTVQFTIKVNAINDPPVFTSGQNITIKEDAGAQTFTGWASSIGPGAANETGQILQFKLTTSNDALFKVKPAVSSSGILTFTTQPDSFGTVKVIIRLYDNGGGCDSSSADTFLITILPVNDQPHFIAGASQTVYEDAGPQKIISWATAISAGANETDSLQFLLSISNPSLFSTLPVISAKGNLSFTTAPNASGTASIDVLLHDFTDSSAHTTFDINVQPVNDPPSFTAGPAISVPEDAALQTYSGWATISSGPPDESNQTIQAKFNISDTSLFSVKPSITSDGKLTFSPAANRFGSATIIAKVIDNGGTANGGIDSTVSVPFTISITPVNDPPQFTAGSDITVSEDAGKMIFKNWATNITPGPYESIQKHRFLLRTDNPSFFSSLPVIDSSGTLTFTTAPDSNGSAEVKVRLYDDGSTADGGIDSSAEAVFTIKVTAVNDPPRISILGNYNMLPDTETIISISALDVDGDTPVISVDTLPSFATFITNNGTATLTCNPSDTGTFTITIAASDNIVVTDTTITLHINKTPSGNIVIRNVSSKASTTLYATSSWRGKTVLTGQGTIPDLKPGIYLLSVSDSGSRLEYHYSKVISGKNDTITILQRPLIPLTFVATDTLQSVSGPVYAGGIASVIEDDIDNDGIKDIAYTGDNGVIFFCKGSDSSFADPVILYSLEKEKHILRCADWNEDGINDLILAGTSGSIHLLSGKIPGHFDHDSILYTLSANISGLEIVTHQTSGKAMYIGLPDGTMKYCTFTGNGSPVIKPVRDRTGQIIDIGNDAAMTVADLTGDGKNELLVSNSINGMVQVFSILSTDTLNTASIITTGGMQLGQPGGTLLSMTYETGTELPSIIYSDYNGTLYRVQSILQGDINNDGTVNVLDLQQMGIHWGQNSNDSTWSGAVNLSVSTGISNQVINVMDLQILGKYWGLEK